MNWRQNTNIMHIYILMTQSLDASVSSLMYVRLIGKSVLDAKLYFLSFCTTVLNSSGWNSFLTSCPLCLLVELLLCVQYFFVFWYCFCWTIKSDDDCQLIPPVHKVSFLSFFLVSGLALLCHHMVAYHPCPPRSRGTDRHCLPITQAHLNSFKQLLKLQ